MHNWDEFEDDEKCGCGNLGKELHTCPHALDVGNEWDLPEDEQTLCNCCEECELDCAMDI